MDTAEPDGLTAPALPLSSKDIRRRRSIGIEIAIILVVAVTIGVVEHFFDLRDSIIAWLLKQNVPGTDEMLTVVLFLCFALAVFSYRRWRDAVADARERQRVEADLRALQGELEGRVQQRTAELFKSNTALQAKVAEHVRAEESLTQSEEFNRRMVAASPIGILLLDHDTRVTYENPVMRQMMGVPAGVASPVIGRKLLEIPPVKTALPAATAQALLAGEPVRGEVIHYHSLMGPETDLELYSAPVQAGPGPGQGTILMLVDVTRRMAAELGLRTSEQRYRSLFDDAPIAFWEEDLSRVKARLEALRRDGITDFRAFLASHPQVVAECAGDLEVINVNKATLKLYQATSLDEITQRSQTLFGPEFQDRFIAELVAIADGQTEYHWEGAQTTLAGNAISVDLRWAPLPGFEESLGHVVVSMLDITERQRAETELKRRLSELEAVSRISTALRTAQTLDDMLPLLIDETLSILGGSAGGIWLYDPAHDEVRLAIDRGGGNTRPIQARPGHPGWRGRHRPALSIA
jgi:PAS domain-containing protein